MKKRISGLVVLILILLLGLMGCKKDQETTHKIHEFGEWKTTRKASCIEPGVQTRTCECGEKEKKEIPATGHTTQKIEAVEATCTTEGKAEGTKCSVCNIVLEGGEIVPPTHKLETLKAVAVTCTRAGKGEGARCTLCGEIVTRQKKIRATGHNYEGDACTKCGKHLPDTAVALLPDQFNEAGPANFVTKEAYPGGTTLTFHVLLPKQGPWWGISWTTDPAKANIYDWSENGSGTLLQAKAGEWTEVSVTLPEDGKNYYMFFMAEKGQWEGKEILVDDVTITDKNGKTIGTDSFDYGIDAGLFHVEKVNKDTSMAVVYAKERCAEHVTVADAAVAVTCDAPGKKAGSHCSECGKVLVKQEIIPALGHKWDDNDICKTCGKEREDLVAVMVIDKLNEAAPMNFITKEAYPGGSTITFSAYAPAITKPDGNPSWWGISWTTDPSKVSLYDCHTPGMGKVTNTVDGTDWVDYTVTLPSDDNEYYIYFVGAKGEWQGKELEINNFAITSAAGKVLAEESFDDGVENGIFNVVATDYSEATVVYDRVLEVPCSEGHTTVTVPGKEPDCTNPGYTESSYCSACGAVLVAQETIPAKGHDYDEITGECECGEKLMDRAVAINVDAMNDYSNMNFMTRQAYAGGSTISFKAYVPSGTAWWAISYTTDPTVGDLYAWAEKGYGAAQNSTYDTWKEYSLTLPDDENTYYFYIVGEKGQWGGKELLIDNVKITNKLGETVAEDDFNEGMHSGIFKITELGVDNAVVVREVILGEVCMHPESKWHKDADIDATCTDAGIIGATRCECGKVMIEEEIVPASGHTYENGICGTCGEREINKAAAITINKMGSATGTMSFITKEAYPAGSKVTFDILIPENINGKWWGIGITTSPATADLYKWLEGEQYGKTLDATIGEWTTCSIDLPTAAGEYYVYLVAAVGEWPQPAENKPDTVFLIDNVVITDASGTSIATDNFNTGFENGLFTVNPNGEKAVALYTFPEEEEVNKAAAITINKMGSATGTMSFITKEAYPAGSKVTFDILIPENINGKWWGIGITTSPATADLYKWLEGEQYGKTLNATIGEWTTCSIDLPTAAGEYYVYLVAAVGEWPQPAENKPDTVFLIDNVVITDASGTPIATDNFNAGFENGLFTVNPNGEKAVALYTFPEEGEVNKAAAITINKMGSATGTMSFITKEAYPAGSKVTFDILIPENINGKWWGIGITTSPATADLYKWLEGEQYGKTLNATIGEWTTCSIDLPTAAGEYYVYLVAAVGEWPQPAENKPDTVFLIDNVVITDASGTPIATDNFNAGFENSLFTVNPNGENAVALYTFPEEEEVPDGTKNYAAAITIETINDVNWDVNEPTPSFITKEKYVAGSTISFKYFIPEGADATWWNVNFTTNQNKADNYAGTSIGIVKGTWTEFTTTIPEGDAQYIYIAGPCGEWKGTQVLIDDFKIMNGSTVVAEDNFDNGLENGLFTVNSCGTSAVSLSEVE